MDYKCTLEATTTGGKTGHRLMLREITLPFVPQKGTLLSVEYVVDNQIVSDAVVLKVEGAVYNTKRNYFLLTVGSLEEKAFNTLLETGYWTEKF